MGLSPTGDTSVFKFITIALYVVVLLGILVGVIKAGITWNQTGDYKPMVEATLGQIVYWDNQIYEGVAWLKDSALMDNIPESFREDFKEYLVKQIIFSLVLFFIVGYMLFKLGNWIAGQAAMNPMTDVIIVALILFFVFPASEVGYGWIMHKELNPPYRGVLELARPSTWQLMFDNIDLTQTNQPIYNTTLSNTSNYYVNLGD